LILQGTNVSEKRKQLQIYMGKYMKKMLVFFSKKNNKKKPKTKQKKLKKIKEFPLIKQSNEFLLTKKSIYDHISHISLIRC